MQLGPNIIVALPVVTALLIPAGTELLSHLTNFFGDLSYEFYIIHVTMMYVSRIWFSGMLPCFISSFILALVMAVVVNRTSKIFFSTKGAIENPKPE